MKLKQILHITEQKVWYLLAVNNQKLALEINRSQQIFICLSAFQGLRVVTQL